MKSYRWVRTSPIAERSNNTVKSGQIARIAKRLLTFENIFTKERFQITDLKIEKNKRNAILDNFENKYLLAFKRKEISMLCFVISADKYESPSKLISNMNRKFKRKGLIKKAHMWLRDIGDIDFDLHSHCLFIIGRINGKVFRNLFKLKKIDAGYKVVLCNSFEKSKGYLRSKEIYRAFKQRAYGCSRKFK